MTETTMNVTVGALIGRGILLLILGILMIIFTQVSTFAIAVLLSILLIFLGIALLAGGFSFSGKAGIAPAILGILVIILGIVTLFNPVAFTAFMVWFIGIASIVYGIFEIVAAIVSGKEINRGLLIFSGIIGIIFGLIVVLAAAGAFGVISIAGINVTVFGVAFILTLVAGIMFAIIGIASIIEGIVLKASQKKAQ
ncbi:MAG TPA: DUF308 domain-containing protein [Methanocorpusculum sp.]|nr:DUF308 domain-containing protein [Methanocorpusculum sp.]